MMTREAVASTRASVEAERPDMLDLVFLASALIAPLELYVVHSLTLYDVVIGGLAFLIWAGPRRMRPLPKAYVPAVVIFIVSALVSSFRATLPSESLTQLAQFGFVFFVQIPVILTIARSPLLIRWSLILFAIGSFAVVVVSVATSGGTEADRVLTYYSENPNPLGYASAYVLPFAICFIVELWRRGRHTASIVGAAVLIYLVVYSIAVSASRGAAIALLVALPVFLALRKSDRVDLALLARLVVVVCVVGAASYAFFQTPYFPPLLKGRIQGTIAEEGSLTDDRERLAAAGIRAFESSPFVGTGLDNFRYVSTRYERAATPQAPHNIWIQFLAQIGLVGTAAFAFIILRWFVDVVRAWRRSAARSSRHQLLAAFIASMAAIMTIFMTTPIMVHRHYWLLFGLGLALAMAPAEPASEEVRA
jgi:O-antigen ligase